MSGAPGLDAILEANGAFVEAGRALDEGPRPSRQLAVVTCMDVRIDVAGALGIDVGEAHLIRNAGGRVSDDALRSLIVSTAVLGVREVGVIHHTSCGMSGTAEGMRERIAEATGADPSGLELLMIDEPEAAVAADVRRVLDSPLVLGEVVVWGALYDVADGRLRVVVEPGSRAG